jgi:sugar phosphate isomerase/epimerase
MKICFGTINVRYRLPVEEILPRAAELGYEGVEIWGPHLDGKPDADLAALREKARDLGLAIPCLTPYFCFTGTQEMWDASLAIARRFIHYAQLLGAPLIRGLTSVGIDLKDYKERSIAKLESWAPSEKGSEEQWEHTIQAYRTITAEIEKTGTDVVFAMETHGNNLTDTLSGCRRLLAAVDSPHLKILYQNFLARDPIDGLDEVYDQVVHVHVQYVGGRGGKGFLPVVTKLAQKGYAGWVNVEFTDAPAQGEGLEVLWANAGRDLRLVREAAGSTKAP